MIFLKFRFYQLLAVMALLLAVPTTVFADGHLLVVEKTDGHVYRFWLSTQPEMTFGTTTVRFANAVTTIEMPRSEMKEFRFVNGSDVPTSIDAQSLPQRHVPTIGQESVVVENLHPSDRVRLVDASGRVLDTVQLSAVEDSQSSSTAQFSLSSLPKGVYIIQINQQETIKFVRK